MVGRKPGTPKTGGRKAGVPNKKTQSLLEKCEQKGIDLFDSFLDLIQDEQAEPSLRFQALKEAAQYVYPKRKAMEVSGTMDLSIQREYESLAHLSEEELKQLLLEELKK